MPPRLPASCTAQLNNCLDNALILSTTRSTATAAGRPSPSCHPNQNTWAFSTSTPRELTLQRKLFYQWLKRDGKRLKFIKPTDQPGPAYVDEFNSRRAGEASRKRQPFVANPEFIAHPVLSVEARELIWHDVMVSGLPLKAVSVRRNVDLPRVAAVIRMMSIEKQMPMKGMPLAEKYCAAMMRMLPVHNLLPTDHPFEPINEIDVHPRTQQQVFVPTSESRHFTRWDAAHTFGNHILPPDRKIRIPELIRMEKQLNKGVEDLEARTAFVNRVAESEKALAKKAALNEQRLEEKRTRVKSGRFEFRFEEVNANAVGKKGRSRLAAGWRYGVPHDDRARGAVKIPTEVV